MRAESSGNPGAAQAWAAASGRFGPVAPQSWHFPDDIGARLRRLFFDAPPIFIIGAMFLLGLGCALVVGMSFMPSLPIALAPGAAILALAVWLHLRRADPRAFDAVLHLGLWFLWTPLGVLLSYVTIVAGFPLQDRALAAADAAFGFHWIGMASTLARTPWLTSLLGFAYRSYLWQPTISVIVIAWLGPRGRNREFLTQVLAGLLITLAISTVVPAMSPAAAFGLHQPHERIISALQDGHYRNLPYMGILSFPSFHAIMAVLFANAHRGFKPTFFVFLPLNLLMLAATPYCGDHYLVDVVAGIFVAALVILFTQKRHVSAGVRPRPHRQPELGAVSH